MGVNTDWAADGINTLAAKSVGLTDATPLMVKTRSASRDAAFFTAAGGNYFLLDLFTSGVRQYTQPADLEGILSEMRKPFSKRSLEMKDLPIIET